MLKIIKRVTGILILLLILSFYSAKQTHADFSVGVYPPIIQIQATVPTIITKEITLVNASEEEADLQLVVRQFTHSPYSNGQVQYASNPKVIGPDKDIFQKIQLLDEDEPVNTIVLLPKQKKTFTIRVGLPKDEPAADYYFSFLFMSRSAPKTDANGTTINAGIGANVLLSIGPQGPTTGFLDDFSSPWFLQNGPVPFSVLINNTSRHFIAPTGQILIRNMFGQLVGKVDLLSVNVLGQSSRYIPGKNQGNDLKHPLALWNERVLFGPYRANIVISLSPEGPLYTKSIYFFVMPIQYIIGFFITVAIAIVVVERVRKKIKSS